MIKGFYRITDPDLRKTLRNVFGEESGTYSLHWFEREKPKGIYRLMGIDGDGILYIGKTDTPLYKRISSLQVSILSNSEHSLLEPVERGHKTLSKKFFRIRKKIDLNDLFVSVHPTIVSPKKDEGFSLDKYASKYGELPPLNGDYGEYEHWELF